MLFTWTSIELCVPPVSSLVKSAGIVMQGDVRAMLERDLDPYFRDHIVHGTDDFTGFCRHTVDESSDEVSVDWMGLARSFIAMI